MSTKIHTIAMEASTYFTCGSLVLMLSYAFVKVRSGTKVAFLFYLIVILILANISYIIYMSIYNLRHRLEQCGFSPPPGNCYRHLYIVVTAAMSLDYIYYACINSALWCYCFKYWVVSIEMTRSIRN